MDAALALDIGGTKLAAGVVTPDGHVHGFTVEPARSPRRRMPWERSAASASHAAGRSMLPPACS